METFVIGDIEDSLQAFKDACECISNHPNARLIFLGDIYHPHTSSMTISNAEIILNLLGIRIRQFFLEGVTLEPSEYRRHSERISQAFRDLYLQKELEKYTLTDKLRLQIFTSDKLSKNKSDEDAIKNEGSNGWKGPKRFSKDSFSYGFSQSYSYSDKHSSPKMNTDRNSSAYDSENNSAYPSYNHASVNGEEARPHSSIRNNHEHFQCRDDIYNATRTLRLNCKYKLWREVQEDEEGPIFLFGNKEIDLMRDLADLTMVAVNSQGTIFYNIDYFRNKRRKTISQSLTIHEVNVLLTYLSLCEDAVVIGRTLFTHIYVNARQIYYHAHQFNTSSVITNPLEHTRTNSIKLNGEQTHEKVDSRYRTPINVPQRPLPSFEANSSFHKASSIDESHPIMNYYMNKRYNHENKRFIHIVVGHSKCFGSFIDHDHPEIQITMLDITGDTSFDPEHPHGRTGPAEIGFKNYLKFIPCSSEENTSLVAHITFNSTDPLIQEMLKFKFPAKQLFLTSKPSSLISVLDYYRSRREYYLQKLEAGNLPKNMIRSRNHLEDMNSFQKQSRDARSFQPSLNASELSIWRKSTHKRSASENNEKMNIEPMEFKHSNQRRSSICLAEMDLKMNENDKESQTSDSSQNTENMQEPSVITNQDLINSNQDKYQGKSSSDNVPSEFISPSIASADKHLGPIYEQLITPYDFTLNSSESIRKPIRTIRFSENHLDVIKHGKTLERPLVFNIMDEHKPKSISTDSSSNRESSSVKDLQAVSTHEVNDEIKLVSFIDESAYYAEEEDDQLPSSLKIEKSFNLTNLT